MQKKMKLSYKDERDKCYGATGMAMGVVIFDGEDMLAAVDIDGDPSSTLEFVADYYFSGNPRVSAKVAWNKILHNYNLSMGVSLANVLCRSLVMENHEIENDVVDQLRQLMIEEGHQSCSLDDDEINHIFDKNFSYLHRIFAHRGVQSVAHDFADTLLKSRRMSRSEVIEHLRALNML